MRAIVFFVLMLTACSTHGDNIKSNHLVLEPEQQQTEKNLVNTLPITNNVHFAQKVDYQPNTDVNLTKNDKINDNNQTCSQPSSNMESFHVVTTSSSLGSNSACVNIKNKNNYPLYISSFIAAIGILINALAFWFTRKDKKNDHNKGVIDEYWYRTILLPELRLHAKELVKVNLAFWLDIKSDLVYSESKYQKFIISQFNVNYHKVLMTVETLKLIDNEFNQGEEVQQIFESLEDKAVEASYTMSKDNFHQRLNKINAIIDTLNELEPKLTKALLQQHRQFSNVSEPSTSIQKT